MAGEWDCVKECVSACVCVCVCVSLKVQIRKYFKICGRCNVRN